eukprot:8265760-Alexandrium_andersonii.AAC.1
MGPEQYTPFIVGKLSLEQWQALAKERADMAEEAPTRQSCARALLAAYLREMRKPPPRAVAGATGAVAAARAS